MKYEGLTTLRLGVRRFKSENGKKSRFLFFFIFGLFGEFFLIFSRFRGFWPFFRQFFFIFISIFTDFWHRFFGVYDFVFE